MNRSVAGRVKATHSVADGEGERARAREKEWRGTVGQSGREEAGKATQANRQVRDETAEGRAVNKRGD